MSVINGNTRLCGIIGYPVEHSLSPAMHNAAFEQLALNWAYVPFLVRPENLTAAVAAVRAFNLAGVNVTVPHKQAVVGYIDDLSPAARLSGAVNTIVNLSGNLIGHNTDGEGFIRALREEAGISVKPDPVLILGAGGAAKGVAVALAINGVSEIIIANRTGSRAEQLCHWIKEQTGCAASVLRWTGAPVTGSGEYRDWASVLGRVKLIIQATTMGMFPRENDVPPVPFELLNSGHIAADLIYNPRRTRFISSCEAAGSRVLNGMGMLLHQGVIAFELWTGRTPPVEVMRRALQEKVSK